MRVPKKCHRLCPQCRAENHVRKYACDCGYFWPRKQPETPEGGNSLGMTAPQPVRAAAPCLLHGPAVISGILSEIRCLEMEQLRLGNDILRKELMLHELFASLGVSA